MDTNNLQPALLQTFPPKETERASIRQLLKKSPLRSQFLPVLDGGLPLKLNDDTIERLLSELELPKDKHWKRRAVAAWILGVSTLPEHRREVIIAYLRHSLKNPPKGVTRYGERSVRSYLRTLALVLSLLTILIGGFALTNTDAEDRIPVIEMIMAILFASGVSSLFVQPIALPLSVIHDVERNNQARAMAAQALTRHNILEALPELLAGACDKAPEISEWCRSAITQFLPQITEANQELMPLNNEELLGRILETGARFALGNVILDYLERFGQGRSCSSVAYYLNTLDFQVDMQRIEEIRAKCRRVYAVLKERRERSQESEMLLRHSIAPNAQPDELLRPAADSQAMPAEQLLRASNSE